MPDEDYIRILEEQNASLMEKLAAAETRLSRRRGTYPLFKITKSKKRKNNWIMEQDFITNCDDPKMIIIIAKYVLNNPPGFEFGKEIIGFQYWRQTINYRWALSGMSKFLDVHLNRVANIDINPKTGKIL
jgi:hypothetical protein